MTLICDDTTKKACEKFLEYRDTSSYEEEMLDDYLSGKLDEKARADFLQSCYERRERARAARDKIRPEVRAACRRTIEDACRSPLYFTR